MRQDVPSKHARINAIALRTMIWMVMQRPCDYYELAEATGLAHSTIRRWITPWRKKSGDIPRLIHIAEWHPDERGYLTRPAFFYAPGKADKPSAATPVAQRKREYRERQKAIAAQLKLQRALAGAAA